MDSVELSLCELDLRFYFVTPDGQSHKELKDLSYCFERIAERFDTNDNFSYLSEPDAITLAQTQPLTRKSIFLFDKFDGAAFRQLRKTRATILGPRCIIDCFHNEYNIPNVPSPIFNVALRDNTVCTSGLKTVEKDDVERLVQYMGGNFLASDLALNTTYLVTNTTMSIKYEKAVENGIRCVTMDWVHRLWQLSTTEGVVLDASNADSLYAEHRIPHFHKLGITSTGIAQAQRLQLKALIEANGGTFYGSFKSELINILVACRSQTDSDKFRAAVKCRKLCLTPEWFFDSVARGYTLPVDDYRVVAPQTEPTVRPKVAAASTPTKTAPVNESAFNADCTSLSVIMGNVTVNESRMSTGSSAGTVTTRASKTDKNDPYKAVLADINVQLAKKSGSFLDGCNVFLCGFNAEEKLKLAKILGNACATLFDEYDSRVEYVVCGAPIGAELQLISGLNSRSLVTLKWLVASIEQKCPAAERSYLYSLPANRKPSPDDPAALAAVTASPASKKNMASMSNSFRKPQPRRLQMDDDQVQAQANADADLLQQYLVAPTTAAAEKPAAAPPKPSPPKAAEAAAAAPVAEPQDLTADETENVQYFAGLTFIVDGFTTDSEEALVEDIEMAGGEIVTQQFGGTVDYVIVPMDIFKLDDVLLTGRHLVNDYWVADSAQAQCCVDIAYYHRPLEWQSEENKPLADMLLVLTTYSGSERSYLTNVGRIMGADVQDRYIKTQQPVLICPRPEGAKYNGAIKWGLPVVNCEWLLTCLREAQRVPMRPYLVGASVAPTNEPVLEPAVVVAAAKPVERPPVTSTALPVDTGTDSLQITAQESPIRPPAPVAMEPEERHPSVETPESSVERLKRQRPSEFAAPSQTPVLKHRRLSEIASTSRRDSPFGGSQSPQAVDYETNLRNRLACVSTPCRETVFNELMRLKEAETPETKRRLQALSTPDMLRSPIPAEYRTPAREQRLREIKDMHYLGPVPSPAPITPFAEVQRRFWRNALGDSYVSPSQIPPDSQTTVADQPSVFGSTQADFALDAPSASSTQQQPQQQPANAHVKRLSDFIIQHKTNDRTPPKPDGGAGSSSGRGLLPPSAVLPLPSTQPPLTCAGATEPIDSVGWCDPAEFYEGSRFRQRDTMQYVGTPKFHISCLDAVRLERISAHIVQLGGELCETRGGYDPTCTHVLCEKPSRSEKIFSAIAAGKWLLSLRYVEDSAVEQTFLNEERYEFGNPLSAEQVPESMTDETGKAAYRWRKKLQQQREQLKAEGRSSEDGAVIGAFSAFRVILHTSKKVPFRNLLEAGGGTVLDVTEPYETSKEALTATHCVLDTRNKMSSRDRQALQRAGVACVNIMFLQAFVSSDVAPDPKDHAA